MLRIIFPLVSQAFFTVMLIYFIGYWNDYQTPLLYLPSRPTISLGLLKFRQNTQNDIASESIKLGAAILVFAPIFAVFIIFQKRLMGKVAIGGIKM